MSGFDFLPRCSAGARALLIPFDDGGETEQALRADRLADAGLAEVIRMRDLTTANAVAAIERAATRRRRPAHEIALGGARETAVILRRLLNSRLVG